MARASAGDRPPDRDEPPGAAARARLSRSGSTPRSSSRPGLVFPPASTTIPPRRVGRTIARPRLRVVASRKVRAPQRRVAGNARPPRGEDQCHRDVARTGPSPDREVKRGKLCSEQGQIGGRGSSARATGRSGGRGRAAQSSGRPLEPSGNRRPEMDDRRRGFGRGTELGLQAGSPPSCAESLIVRCGAAAARRRDGPRRDPAGHPAVGQLVLVRTEDVARRAGRADLRARLEVSERQRHAPVGVEAAHFVARESVPGPMRLRRRKVQRRIRGACDGAAIGSSSVTR